jgi:glutamine amidotransferase-like uncharacterized protein
VVLARYRSAGHPIAIMIVPYGRGRVAVSGPHPEATPGWYTARWESAGAAGQEAS